MTDAPAMIRRLHQHRAWVNETLRDAAAKLTDEQLHREFDLGFRSVFGTLVHLYAAEFVWLTALEGNPDPPPPKSFAFESLDELNRAWSALEARWSDYLGGLSAEQLAQPVRKVSTSSGAGRAFETPASDVLMHVCTHAQYTAAQLVGFMKAMGVQPLPDVMLITLSRGERDR